jgi:nitrite reductase/ring-hydroxylating ferredoxin subunit
MGSIPVAKPTPLRTLSVSRRILPLALLGTATIAVFGVMLAVMWPSGGVTGIVSAGRVGDLSVEQPVYNNAGFFVVLLESGEVIALSEKDTHHFGENPDCPVKWYAELVFDRTSGWLRGKCSGSNFLMTGERVSGPAPRGMDRFPVEVSGSGEVYLNTSRILCAPDYVASDCR